MKIYGADFSGARDPKGIYYAVGRLSRTTLTVEEVQRCDDRLDLFAAIVDSNAPWGLDFPFAVATEAYALLGLTYWRDLLSFTGSIDRDEFGAYLRDVVPSDNESRCQHADVGCRHTDVESGSFSPLKQYQPNMRAMVYGGFKLLGYLNRHGVRVYPFDDPDPTRPRVYEVYPANTWQTVGVRRTTEIERFVEAFNRSASLTVRLSGHPDAVADVDAADSVVACVTLASAIHAYNLDARWGDPPLCTTPAEWEARRTEGLIVRVHL